MFINILLKLSPLYQIKNPVMFVVYVGNILVSVLCFQKFNWFSVTVICWLWGTLLFANFAESLAEVRGRAQAKSLRKARKLIEAKRLINPSDLAGFDLVKSIDLKIGDYVLIEQGSYIPVDGEVIEGIASVNESAITGESAPVIRESGGDKSSVTGGTKVISDWLVMKVTANPGETFLDHMINLVEGSKRQKTPNEIALNILLAALTIVALIVCATLLPYSIYIKQEIDVIVLVALFTCLAPTTIGALISAIGIAGMDRLIQKNVVALSGRAIEAAGDINVLLLDKTGTITLGNRQASEFIPIGNVPAKILANAAQLSSLVDETVEGRSIVVLAKEQYGMRGRNIRDLNAEFIPFSAQTRMSGVNFQGYEIRKGAPDAIISYVCSKGGYVDNTVLNLVDNIAKQGSTPLLVSEGVRVLGVIVLKDIIKGGIRERFSQLRRMGIKTIMVTGDNSFTAAAIAAEAGVDDFLAEATPEDKLNLINYLQQEGKLVAMAGDGTNDAPALAQADVAVAMNTGTQIAKEAGNMIDLDSNPTKLIEIVQIGKQLLITRGALTTFSIANDVAKYFAILPFIFSSAYPKINKLNIMHLTNNNAILAAIIFNALIILGLIPLALKGVKYRCTDLNVLLRNNILIYGLGGLVLPFFGIKFINIILNYIL